MPRALLTAVRADVIPTWRSFMSTGTIECAGRLEANFREFRFNKFQVYVRAGHSDNMAALFKVALEQAHRYEKAILCNPSIIGGEDVLAPLKAMHDVLRGAPVQAGGAVPTVNAGGTAAGTTTVAGSVSVVVGGGGGGAGAAGAAAPPPKKKSRKEMTKAERALAALSFDAPGARNKKEDTTYSKREQRQMAKALEEIERQTAAKKEEEVAKAAAAALEAVTNASKLATHDGGGAGGGGGGGESGGDGSIGGSSAGGAGGAAAMAGAEVAATIVSKAKGPKMNWRAKFHNFRIATDVFSDPTTWTDAERAAADKAAAESTETLRQSAAVGVTEYRVRPRKAVAIAPSQKESKLLFLTHNQKTKV